MVKQVLPNDFMKNGDMLDLYHDTSGEPVSIDW